MASGRPSLNVNDQYASEDDGGEIVYASAPPVTTAGFTLSPWMIWAGVAFLLFSLSRRSS